MKVKKNNAVKKNVEAKVKAAQTASTKAAKPEAKAKAQAPKAEKEARSGVNIGKTSGLRVMAYQDHTFAINDKPERRLTDEELAQDWRNEFPNSRAVQNGRITADMVRAVRRLYNSGTGGHGTPGTEHTSHPYVLDGKNRVKSVYRRERKEKDAPETKTTAADTKKVKAAKTTAKSKAA